MRTETELRRADQLPGEALRLSGPPMWTFPSPEAMREEALQDRRLAKTYGEALLAVRDAEDDRHADQAEVELVAYLLARNYRLTPSEYRELLRGDDPADLRNAIHAVAACHVRRQPHPACRTTTALAREPILDRFRHQLAALWAIANEDLDWRPRTNLAP